MGLLRTPNPAAAVLVTLLVLAPVAGAEDAEVRLSLDVKDAPIGSIVRLLVELGGRQVVFDPGLDCALTLKLHEVRWLQTLETTLSACGLWYEETGGVLWVATRARLREEAEARRRLAESRASAASGLAVYKLSYARAERMAPLVERLVAPQGQVTIDPRTNVLLIRY